MFRVKAGHNQKVMPFVLQGASSFLGASVAIGFFLTFVSPGAHLGNRDEGSPTETNPHQNFLYEGGSSNNQLASVPPNFSTSTRSQEVDKGKEDAKTNSFAAIAENQLLGNPSGRVAAEYILPADPESYALYAPSRGRDESINFGDPFLSADTE